MSWSTHLRSAQDFVKVGDKIKAQILTLDREDRKLLSIKPPHYEEKVGTGHTA